MFSRMFHFTFFLLCSYCLVESVENFSMMKVLSESLCHYTDYCSRNATYEISPDLDDRFMLCCDDCSCSADCWKRGNCCPDKEAIYQKEPIETCETTLRSAGNAIDNYINKPRYFVIKDCPKKTDPDAPKCRGELKSSLDEIIWVTDKHTNTIFSNKYCAICHGVEDYSSWDIETNCLEIMDGQHSLSSVVRQIIDECSLTVVPPKNENHINNICLMPEISKCNITGEWEIYNQSLEQACNSFKQIYVHEFGDLFPRKVVYGNVFCFLCNSPSDRVTKRLCRSSSNIVSIVNKLVHSGILNFREIETATNTEAYGGHEHDPVCDIGEVFDPFQRRCLILSCPPLHAPFYGKCVKLVSSTRLLGVSAMLLIRPVWNETTLRLEGTKKNKKNVAKSLSNGILRSLGLPRGKCKFCTNAIMVNYENNGDTTATVKEFPFFSLVKTNEGCSEDKIVEQFYRLLGKEIQLQVGEVNMTLTVSATSLEEFDRHTDYARSLFETTEDKKCVKHVYDFQLFRKCPSLSLHYEDYLRLMKASHGTHQKRDINSVFNLVGDDQIAPRTENFTAQICMESYLSILPEKNQGFLQVQDIMMALFNYVIVKIVQI